MSFSTIARSCQDASERAYQAFVLVTKPDGHADEPAVRQAIERSTVPDDHAVIGDQSRAHTCGTRRTGGKPQQKKIRCGRVDGDARRAQCLRQPSALPG